MLSALKMNNAKGMMEFDTLIMRIVISNYFEKNVNS